MGIKGKIKPFAGIQIILIVIGLLCASCSNEGKKSPDQKFQAVLEKGLEKYDIRGVSAAIVNSDGVWVGTAGISHDTVAMKPDMLFSIGSVTKNFVAALTLKLVEVGTLSLEDRLSDWMPAYTYVDPEITIRQLLNHTSGIYMFWNNDDLWDALKNERSRIFTPEEVLGYIKEPDFPAGQGWRYSNTNYLLLAMIIEKATGSTLASELRLRLWKPLNLRNYYLWLADSIPDNQAHVFGDNFEFGSAEQDLTFMPRASHESIGFGSSGIVTTAEDLADWGYQLFEGQVLTEKSMHEMLSFVDFLPQSNMKGYGLGVQLFRSTVSHGSEAIGHGGGNIGSTTYMIYLPEYHTSLVVMVNAFPTNSVDYFARGLIKEITRASK